MRFFVIKFRKRILTHRGYFNIINYSSIFMDLQNTRLTMIGRSLKEREKKHLN